MKHLDLNKLTQHARHEPPRMTESELTFRRWTFRAMIAIAAIFIFFALNGVEILLSLVGR